jgi:hypothetical protein
MLVENVCKKSVSRRDTMFSAEGNDKMDSTIIKIISDLPSANADATFRRKVAYLSQRSPTGGCNSDL